MGKFAGFYWEGKTKITLLNAAYYLVKREPAVYFQEVDGISNVKLLGVNLKVSLLNISRHYHTKLP